MISLEERLKALDEAKEKIIHDAFTDEQKKLEDDIRQQLEKLKKAAAVEHKK